jgi:hypothetical protein
MLPIGEWALAAWERWEPEKAVQRMVSHSLVKLSSAKSPWHKCYGPAAAYILTCWRLQWVVLDAFTVVTDQGRVLHLRLDPPAVVNKECMLAVQRWRWRRIEKVMPQLAANGSGRGATMEPLWQLLNSKVCNDDWNADLRGCLKSAIAGRQYPQTRVMAAGWAEHNRCIFCLSAAVDADDLSSTAEDKASRHSRTPVTATPYADQQSSDRQLEPQDMEWTMP